MNEPPNLIRMLKVKEGQLRASLEEARAKFSQTGDKGDHVEQAAREFLSSHLPRRFDIGQGEVIDTHDLRSSQLDIVISDENQPLSFPEGSPGLYVVEGVVAAGEVKSLLTTGELDDIVAKAKKFKLLEKVQAVGELALGRNPAEDPFYHRPPFFAIAFDGNVSLQTIIDRLRDSEIDAVHPHRGLDALFVLGQGFAINLGDGTDVLRVTGNGGENIQGWVWFPSDTVVADLLLWLASTEHRNIRPSSPITSYLSQSMGMRGFHLPST